MNSWLIPYKLYDISFSLDDDRCFALFKKSYIVVIHFGLDILCLFGWYKVWYFPLSKNSDNNKNKDLIL